MPMKASTSGMSFGNSSRKRCERQPETITAWPRWFASRNSTDSRIVSTLSSAAESMNEQVLTMTASACVASLVISTPLFISEPSIISASTRFLAQPSEIKPTRNGRSAEFSFIKGAEVTSCGSARQSSARVCLHGDHILTLPRRLLPRPSGERAGVRLVEYWLQFHGARGFEPETIAPPYPNPVVIYFPPRLRLRLPWGRRGNKRGQCTDPPSLRQPKSDHPYPCSSVFIRG